jgi:hypothetical protein
MGWLANVDSLFSINFNVPKTQSVGPYIMYRRKMQVNRKTICLKGHGNEQVFSIFLHKSLLPRSLTLPFEPFRFWLRIRGDIRTRKSTPRIGDSGESIFLLENLHEFEAKIGPARNVV